MQELKKYMCDDVIGIVDEYLNNDIDYSARRIYCFLQSITLPLVSGGYCIEIGHATNEREFIRIDKNTFTQTYLNNVYVKEMWEEYKFSTLFRMIDNETPPVAVMDLETCQHFRYDKRTKNDHQNTPRNRYGY